MTSFAFFGQDGQILLSNLSKACYECANSCSAMTELKACHVSKTIKRRGIFESREGKVYICSDKSEHAYSSKAFKKFLRMYSDILPNVLSIVAQSELAAAEPMRRLVHNLTSLNAHCVQEIYDFIPQETLANEKQDAQVKLITLQIKENPEGAAQLFSRILKNNHLMKGEFSTFNKLYDPSPVLDKRLHPVRKVILNVFHVYFPDFTDKEIHVLVEEFDGRVRFDYESITVALTHLVTNAAKYCASKSQLKVSFKERAGRVNVCFDMLSFRVEPDERESLFSEGYSSKLTKQLNLAGKGIGLYIARKVIELNGGTIEFFGDCDSARATQHLGIPFENNRFILSFPS